MVFPPPELDNQLTFVMLNIFMNYTPKFFPVNLCSIQVVSMYFHSEWKTVWILIRCCFFFSSDLELQCLVIKKG